MNRYHETSSAPALTFPQPPGLAKTRPAQLLRALADRDNHRVAVATSLKAHQTSLKISAVRLGRALGVSESVARRKAQGRAPLTVADVCARLKSDWRDLKEGRACESLVQDFDLQPTTLRRACASLVAEGWLVEIPQPRNESWYYGPWYKRHDEAKAAKGKGKAGKGKKAAKKPAATATTARGASKGAAKAKKAAKPAATATTATEAPEEPQQGRDAEESLH